MTVGNVRHAHAHREAKEIMAETTAEKAKEEEAKAPTVIDEIAQAVVATTVSRITVQLVL